MRAVLAKLPFLWHSPPPDSSALDVRLSAIRFLLACHEQDPSQDLCSDSTFADDSKPVIPPTIFLPSATTILAGGRPGNRRPGGVEGVEGLSGRKLGGHAEPLATPVLALRGLGLEHVEDDAQALLEIPRCVHRTWEAEGIPIHYSRRAMTLL